MRIEHDITLLQQVTGFLCRVDLSYRHIAVYAIAPWGGGGGGG